MDHTGIVKWFNYWWANILQNKGEINCYSQTIPIAKCVGIELLNGWMVNSLTI